ncbi:MAG: hypothetical protein NC400_12000 [Clostridium sp.]|nr:hypothetical protein [Clostridium sp.]
MHSDVTLNCHAKGSSILCQCGNEGMMGENNTKIEKIKKSSKAAYIVTNILKSLLLVCAAIALVSGMLVIGLGGVVNRELRAAFDSGVISEKDMEVFEELGERDLGQMLIDDGNYAMAIGIYVIIFGIIVALLALVLHFVSRIFKSFMESYSPFQPEILKNLKIALVLIVVYTAQSSLGIALIIAMASWCVINIFEYGCELQKQSDETL